MRPVTEMAMSASWKVPLTAASNGRQRINIEVTTMFPQQFAALRYLYTNGTPSHFHASLRRARAFSPGGGKSSAKFFTTLDDQFVLKSVNQAELFSLKDLWPQYFNCMARHYADQAYPPAQLKQRMREMAQAIGLSGDAAQHTSGRTTLCKVFGVFEFQTSEQSRTFGLMTKRTKQYFVLMQKIFDFTKVDVVYDLKGSQRNRLASAEQGSTRMDENLVNEIRREGSFLFCREGTHARLMAALGADANLLAAADVMDYSLIVGVDARARTLRIGIVDFLRKFSFDKRLESYIKTRAGAAAATVQPPPAYCARFVKYMGLYFCPVPDRSAGLRRVVRHYGEELAEAVKRIEALHASAAAATTAAGKGGSDEASPPAAKSGRGTAESTGSSPGKVSPAPEAKSV